MVEAATWRIRSTILGISVIWMVANAHPAESQSLDSTAPLILNAAPQNHAVFLSWSILPSASYAIHWRGEWESGWHREPRTNDNYFVVDSLVNGARYNFRVEAFLETATRLSDPIQAQPRRRDDCNEPAHLIYCTQESFLRELAKRTSPASPVICGGQVISSTTVLPNCLYRVGKDALLLDRYSGSVFTPSLPPASPEDVRRVLQRVVWGATSFERVQNEARGRVEALADSSRGFVDSTASVKSYLITVTPQLYSRVKWFSRPDHIPGRYAIYHEGHVETAILGGAPAINWFLAHGWQVLALDMPLEGLNSVDRRYPLLSHADFAGFDNGETNPIQWFLLPVVAALNMIYDDTSGVASPTVLMAGRSGGGWTTMTYAAMDPRISVAVNIAGTSPASTQLSDSVNPGATPDYEQQASRLYDQVSLGNILLAAGSRAAFFFYSANDICCFRFPPDHPWIRYLDSLSGAASDKVYRVFVDNARQHGLSSVGFGVLGQYLSEIGMGPP